MHKLAKRMHIHHSVVFLANSMHKLHFAVFPGKQSHKLANSMHKKHYVVFPGKQCKPTGKPYVQHHNVVFPAKLMHKLANSMHKCYLVVRPSNQYVQTPSCCSYRQTWCINWQAALTNTIMRYVYANIIHKLASSMLKHHLVAFPGKKYVQIGKQCAQTSSCGISWQTVCTNWQKV